MAGEASFSRTYLALLSTTLDAYLDSGKFTDNIFDATPTLDAFKDKSRTINGGYEITVGIMHETNSTAGSYSGYEQLDVTPQEGATRAFYDPKQYSSSISISGDETTANAGDAEVIDLLNFKTMQAEMSLANVLSQGVHSDGTGNSSKDLTGIAAMIDQTPATTVYAQINPANNSAWQNQAATSVGATATNWVSNNRTQYNSASQGKGTMSGQPDLGITTQTVHEAIEALTVPMLRYTGQTTGNAVNLGVEDIRYKRMRIVWDADCASGVFYGLTMAHAELVMYRGRDIRSAGTLQKPVNQDALVTQVLFKGNLVTNARMKHYVLAGLT